MEWSEVVEHVRAGYRVGRATESSVELRWSFREGTRAIRQQQVVHRVEQVGETYYAIEAEVAVPVHARAGLCATERLAMGTLIERDGALLARTLMPASAATREALDHMLSVIALEAMRLSMTVWRRQLAAMQAQPAQHAQPAQLQQSQPPASTRSAS